MKRTCKPDCVFGSTVPEIVAVVVWTALAALVTTTGSARTGVTTVLLVSMTRPAERARPLRLERSPRVSAPAVKMVPEKLESAPVDTAPVTCQKTLSAFAWLTSTTALLAAVLSAPVTWKINTAFGSPPPSKVMVPVNQKAAPVV
jgi:hypothetical protein